MAEMDPKMPDNCVADHADVIGDEVVLGLEDGRALVFTCQQILALEPIRIVVPDRS